VVPEQHSISWSIQPNKKSINFGIFKHPGTKNVLPSEEVVENATPTMTRTSRSASVAENKSDVVEKLQVVGIKAVVWMGRCEADKVSMGRYDIPPGEGGTYGLVFDNTFSKQTSKNVTLVLMTHPTNEHESTESLVEEARPHSKEGTSCYTGILYKKRRKKGQGYAKRFFSLDFTSSTLSYYQNRHTSALRGAVPLSLSAVGADEKTREFSVDSGAEVWHLKALNKKDFEGWKDALERASTVTTPTVTMDVPRVQINPREEREWEKVEGLVSQVSGTRDAIRGLVKDTAIPESPPDSAGQYFPEVDESKRSFWKRKPSVERSPSALFQRSVSAQLAVPSPGLSTPVSPRRGLARVPSTFNLNVHERCMALLNDLDKVVGEFSELIAESKARRQPLQTNSSRLSLDSVDDQEFFDADDGQLLNIRRSSDYDREEFDDRSEVDSETSSHDAGFHQMGLFPPKPDRLPPLPLPLVKRRISVMGPKQPPPSIIGFLRKNAGKDLSQVAMPVTANEPTSLLQRLAESMEYPQLLDAAAGAGTPGERLMYVSAFAVSFFSYNRVKERALRKPFNPMLGETFELVREDLGFRFIAEKVSHHPVRMACQAESLNNGGWCYAQSPKPEQKFWGKSVELNNDGRARVKLHSSGERFSWNQATCFLRNVIAGEKYVEPVQTMTVQNETNGMRAVISFKAGGMFSGRSEDVTVEIYQGEEPMGMGLTGKWTESLSRDDTGETIWKVGSLVPNAAKFYGFTTFAAALNEITEVEAGHLPPTDSRLRPDQQALEMGDVDKAEGLKAKLEERQRARRKVLENKGQTWKPQFFEKIDNVDGEDEVWMLKQSGGYWDKRVSQDWKGVQEVFEI
jgi:hypothetical protein